MNEIQDYYINKRCPNIYSSLPFNLKSQMDVEDIKHELYVYFMTNDKLVRETNPSVINKIISIFAKQLIKGSIIHNECEKRQWTFDVLPFITVTNSMPQNNNSTFTNCPIIVDTVTPQKIYEDKMRSDEFMKKCDIFYVEIEQLCHKYNLPYDKKHPVKSLYEVLNLTLNVYSDEEFDKIPYKEQMRLGELGDAMKIKNLNIKNGTLLHNKGIKKEIENIVKQLGVNATPSKIKKQLREQGFILNEDTVKVYISQVRKAYGVFPGQQQKKSLFKTMEMLYVDKGCVTIADMRKGLQDENCAWVETTLKSYLQKIRRKYKKEN